MTFFESFLDELMKIADVETVFRKAMSGVEAGKAALEKQHGEIEALKRAWEKRTGRPFGAPAPKAPPTWLGRKVRALLKGRPGARYPAGARVRYPVFPLP